MSLKSIIATPLFLIVAATAGAAEQTRQTTVVQDMATGATAGTGAAQPASQSGPQNYAAIAPGGFVEPPAPGTKIKAPKGGTKLPAVQKVRDAANRSQQADKHKGHIEVDSLSLGAVDSAAGRGMNHGGVLVGLGDGSVRNSAGAPKDGSCVAGCSNNLTPGDGQQRGQTHHAGGVLVGMGDGSVRNGVSSVGSNETISIGSNSTESKPGSGNDSVWMDLGSPAGRAPKGGSLGSLNGVGSIGQISAPPGGNQAAGSEVRTRSFAIMDRTPTAKDGAGTGAVGGNKTQNIGIGRTETTAGGGPAVRTFSGNDGAGARAPGNITLKGQTIKQN